MKKVQIQNEQLIEQVNDHLTRWDGGYTSLSNGANISYHAARRAKINGVHNNTELLSKLCTFFNIEIKISQEVQNTTLDILITILKDTWDGTEPHAELIQNLIKSTKPFKVKERNS